jgi:hypothetical protein
VQIRPLGFPKPGRSRRRGLWEFKKNSVDVASGKISKKRSGKPVNGPNQMGAGALAPGRVCTEFPKDKGFRAFEMLEKIEFSVHFLSNHVVVAGKMVPPVPKSSSYTRSGFDRLWREPTT